MLQEAFTKLSCSCPRTCLFPQHLRQQAFCEEKELRDGILYIFVEKAPACILNCFHPYSTHAFLSARLALLWSVIKYFSAGLWHPGECREMETNGACIDEGLKRQE